MDETASWHRCGPSCPLWGGAPGACLRRISIFEAIDAEQSQALRRRAKPSAVAEGETLFLAGEPASRILLVVRGLVKVYRTDARGREQIIRLLKSGDHFGAGFLYSRELLTVSAQALTGAQVCLVERATVESLIETDPALASRVIAAMADQLRRAEGNLARLALADASQRLAAVLLDLAGEIGRPAGPDRVHLRLPFARPDLAALAGVAPETVSRRLNEMVAAGLISTHGHRGLTIERLARLRESTS
jgi:CRP/FNR family transcriptional regulator